VAAGRKKVNRIHASWIGAQRFEAGRPDGPKIQIDAGGKSGPGPVETLLCALATCGAVDVVEILEKRRTPVASLDIDVIGERAAATPARLTHVTIAFRITGEGIDRPHAERAIDLAVNKYCSVKDSLDPQLPVVWTLELNGQMQ
jgi:putative redox protein